MFWYCHTAPVLFTGIVLSKQSAESCVLNKYYTVFTWPSWNMNKSSLFENIVLELQWNSVIASSGRPRHIFSLLPSSRYSQMTNLPRETTGNHLGENANGTVRTRARRRWEEGEGGGGEGITHRTRTRLSLFFFVTGHHEMCPTGNLTTRWGWGEWRELLWPGRIENLSLLPRWLSTNSR